MRPLSLLLPLLLAACVATAPNDPTACPPASTPPPPTGGSSMIGMTEAEAIAAAKRLGRSYRIVSRDGEMFPVTMDYSEERLNFTIVRGRVTKVENG